MNIKRNFMLQKFYMHEHSTWTINIFRPNIKAMSLTLIIGKKSNTYPSSMGTHETVMSAPVSICFYKHVVHQYTSTKIDKKTIQHMRK